MSKHRFCRDISLEREEPHEGTGNAPARMLMLAWPRGKWRTPRWESVGMSASLSRAVHDAAQNGVHVALVDRVGESDALPHLQAQPESLSANFGSEAELVAAIDGYVAGQVFGGEVDPRVTILCCTDSRRDACCARYGFSTYKALVAVADPSRFNIVQATHIGGCRFAASLVVMPQRQRYGRMTAGQAPAFLESLLRNELFLPAYRGRSDQPEPVQVAELAALKWAAEHAGDTRDVRVVPGTIPEDATEGAELSMQASVGASRLHIRLQARSFHVQGNCSIVADGGGQDTLRWCLKDLTANEHELEETI